MISNVMGALGWQAPACGPDSPSLAFAAGTGDSPSAAIAAGTTDSPPSALVAGSGALPARVLGGEPEGKATLHWALADARAFRDTFYSSQKKVTGGERKDAIKRGNKATKFFRKLFTMQDGRPMVTSVDVSCVDDCAILDFVYVGKGQEGEFSFDRSINFQWKALVAIGLDDEVLAELMYSPITSVRFVPLPSAEPINQRPKSRCKNAVVWHWEFLREDGTWAALEPGSDGKKMKILNGELPDHSRRRKICAAGPLSANGTTFLYGGLEDERFKKYLEERLWSDIVDFKIDLCPVTSPEDSWLHELHLQISREKAELSEQSLAYHQAPLAVAQPPNGEQPIGTSDHHGFACDLQPTDIALHSHMKHTARDLSDDRNLEVRGQPSGKVTSLRPTSSNPSRWKQQGNSWGSWEAQSWGTSESHW